MLDEIRVLIAEDSPTTCRYLTMLVDETPGLRTVGTVDNGDAAVSEALRLQPDVITMDIQMPRCDGLRATERIMSSRPTPVVVVSGLLETDVTLALRALQAGALAILPKLPARGHPAFAPQYRHFVRTLKAMARVRLVARRARLQMAFEGERDAVPESAVFVAPEVLAIGASTGGPAALRVLLGALPADFPLPVLISQHMPHEFIGGLVRWLREVTPLHISIAEDGAEVQAGRVLVARGDAHLTVRAVGSRRVVRLLHDQREYRYQPSVDALFESVAAVYGPAAVGLLLTGMGDDGALGLLGMRRAGAVTMAQDRASSVVYGMPGAAVASGAVMHTTPLAELASEIMKLL